MGADTSTCSTRTSSGRRTRVPATGTKPHPMRLPRLSLTARIFLSSAGIVIAVMATTLFLTQRSAERAAESSIGRGLATTESRVRELLNFEQGVLAGRLKAFASSPDQRSNI